MPKIDVRHQGSRSDRRQAVLRLPAAGIHDARTQPEPLCQHGARKKHPASKWNIPRDALGMIVHDELGESSSR
jgi:hypothetical protein